jgi:glutamate dehydrogenase/leucine dehydrogenase
MEAALDELGLGGLDGKRIAMQGVGNVGAAMIEDLVEAGASVVASEVDADRVADVTPRFARAPVEVRHGGDTAIFSEPCDVFAPNALGGVLGPSTIGLLEARVVCGAANNQLLDERRDDAALAARGIVYVPDFLANRMGIVSCANEQYGTLPDDPAISRHLGRDWDQSVYCTTRRVLARAKSEGVTPGKAAVVLAEELMRKEHPIWPGRGRAILESLVRDDWSVGASDHA